MAGLFGIQKGGERAGRLEHSQHVQLDITKDNSMRKPFVRIPQFKPIGNDSIKPERKENKQTFHSVALGCVSCMYSLILQRENYHTKKKK